MSFFNTPRVGKSKHVMHRVAEAFADVPPEIGFRLENIRHFPESFGNESADMYFGKLRVALDLDRGELWADIVIPNQPKKPISLTSLMERYGFKPLSNDVVVNLRNFFRKEEQRLFKLGEALNKGEIWPEISELQPSDDPPENIRRLTIALGRSSTASKQ